MFYFVKSIRIFLISILLLFFLISILLLFSFIFLGSDQNRFKSSENISISVGFMAFIVVDLILIKIVKIIFFTKMERAKRKMEKLRKQRDKLLDKRAKQHQKNIKKAKKANINEYSDAIIHYLGYVNPINVEYNLRIEKSNKCLEIFFKENRVYCCKFSKHTELEREGEDFPDIITKTDNGYEIEKGFSTPNTYHEVETENILIYSPNGGEWIKSLKKWKKEAKKAYYNKEAKKAYYNREIKKLNKEIREIKR